MIYKIAKKIGWNKQQAQNIKQSTTIFNKNHKKNNRRITTGVEINQNNYQKILEYRLTNNLISICENNI